MTSSFAAPCRGGTASDRGFLSTEGSSVRQARPATGADGDPQHRSAPWSRGSNQNCVATGEALAWPKRRALQRGRIRGGNRMVVLSGSRTALATCLLVLVSAGAGRAACDAGGGDAAAIAAARD